MTTLYLLFKRTRRNASYKLQLLLWVVTLKGIHPGRFIKSDHSLQFMALKVVGVQYVASAIQHFSIYLWTDRQKPSSFSKIQSFGGGRQHSRFASIDICCSIYLSDERTLLFFALSTLLSSRGATYIRKVLHPDCDVEDGRLTSCGTVLAFSIAQPRTCSRST